MSSKVAFILENASLHLELTFAFSVFICLYLVGEFFFNGKMLQWKFQLREYYFWPNKSSFFPFLVLRHRFANTEILFMSFILVLCLKYVKCTTNMAI